MTYVITGLDPARFQPLYDLSDADLAARGAVRMLATTKPGAPCRVSLTDAEPGSAMLLVNHISQPDGPYRAAHAIFVREGADTAGHFVDRIPPVFEPRILSMRGFDSAAMMVDALLSQPGEAESAILQLLANPAIATIHVHNAVRGCFSAKVERHP